MGFVKQFFKYSYLYTILQLLPALASFVILRFYSVYLNESEFAVFNLLTLISNLALIFISFSIDQWYLISHLHYSDDLKKKKNFLFSSLLVISIIALCLFLLFAPFFGVISEALFSGIFHHVFLQFFILFVMTASTSYNKVLSVYFRVEANIKSLLYLCVGQFVLQIVLSYYFLNVFADKILAAQLSKLLGLLLPILAMLVTIYSNYLPRYSDSFFKGMRAYLVPVLLYNLIYWLVTQFDQFIFKLQIGDTELLAQYAMAFNLALISDVLINGILSFVIPDINASLAKKSNKIAINNHIHLFMLLSVTGLFGVFLFSKLILDFFIDPKYNMCFWMIGFILVSNIFRLFYAIHSIPVYFYKQTKILPLSLLFSFVVSLTINLLFIRSLGLVAILFSLQVSKFLQFISIYFYNRNKHPEFSYNKTKVFGLGFFAYAVIVTISLLFALKDYNFYVLWLIGGVLLSIAGFALFRKQVGELYAKYVSR